MALCAKEKIGMINGSCKRDLQKENLRDQWYRCDAAVLSWLVNSLSKEIIVSITFFDSACLFWEDL